MWSMAQRMSAPRSSAMSQARAMSSRELGPTWGAKKPIFMPAACHRRTFAAHASRSGPGVGCAPRAAVRRDLTMRRLARVLGALALVVGTLAVGTTLGAGPAAAAAIDVTPAAAPPGGAVYVGGDVVAGGPLGCAAGDAVTLFSNAFAALGGDFAGVPAIFV